MNIYFQETLTEIKSEEFISELKATGSLVLRLLRLIFLLLGSLAIFIRDVYVSNFTNAIEERESDNFIVEQEIEDSLSNPDKEQPLMLPAPKSSISEVTTVNRPAQLKSLKAAGLREIAEAYSISYQNKSQAIQDILKFELTLGGI